MNKLYIVILGMITMLVLVSTVFAHGNNDNQCNRNNPENCPEPTVICGNGEHVGNPHCNPTSTPTITECHDCVTPTPTIVQEVTPTGEATPSATPPIDEPTATPTQAVSNSGNGGNGNDAGDPNSCVNRDCNTFPYNNLKSSYDGSTVGWK